MSVKLNEIALTDGIFSAEDCDELVAAFKDGPFETGTVSHSLHAPEVRRSDVRFQPFTEQYEWVFDRISNVVQSANMQFYQFDIRQMEEGFQFARYTPGGHYSWHADIGDEDARQRRKLSLVLMLNEDYEGGELQFFPMRVSVPARKGRIALFPSYLIHRVAPVSAGVRYSLTAWVAGQAPFK